jgi:membrane dipeptidase
VGVGSDNSITPTIANDAYRKQLADFAVIRQSRGIAAPREDEVLFVEELNLPRRMETIADALLARRHSETRIEKILGGNWLRIFETTWRG